MYLHGGRIEELEGCAGECEDELLVDAGLDQDQRSGYLPHRLVETLHRHRLR